MIPKSYIIEDARVIPLLGAQSFSTGDGLELSQRFGYDYSKSPQSLVFRRRNTAMTASMQLSFTNKMCIDAGFINIMQYLDTLQDLVGKLVDLIWCERQHGSFVVVSVQISAPIDPIQIFSDISLGFEFTQGFVKHETLATAVGTLQKPR